MFLKFFGLESKQLSVGNSTCRENMRDTFSAILDCIAGGQFEQAKTMLRHVGFSEAIPHVESIQAMAQGMLADSVNLSMHINESCHIGAKLSRISRDINQRSTDVAEAISRFSSSGSDMHSGVSAIDRINQVVGVTQERVDDLVKSTEEIRRILSIIASISNQTKLLSLNATIEAARAGEAGRGFSVVAGEVKKLAEETAQSAEDIRQKIESLSGVTQEISTRMEDVTLAVRDGLLEQQTVVDDISQGIVEIAALTGEGVSLIDKTLGTIDLSESVISKCLAHFSDYELEHLTVQLAKSDHAIWKKKLSSMVLGRTRMDSGELTDHTKCNLGQWYYSDESKDYQKNPAFRDMEVAHIAVHHHGMSAVKYYEAGDLDGALHEIEQVEQASRIVLEKLQALHE